MRADRAHLILASVVVLLEKGDGVAVEWERDVLFLLFCPIAFLSQYVLFFLVVFRYFSFCFQNVAFHHAISIFLCC